MLKEQQSCPYALFTIITVCWKMLWDAFYKKIQRSRCILKLITCLKLSNVPVLKIGQPLLMIKDERIFSMTKKDKKRRNEWILSLFSSKHFLHLHKSIILLEAGKVLVYDKEITFIHLSVCFPRKFYFSCIWLHS